MLTLQSIFASGWLQITILLILFYGFTRWTFKKGIRRGYAIGWLLGVFFIVAFGSLFPGATLQITAAQSAELTFPTVLISSCVGTLIAFMILGITYTMQKAWFRQIFAVAGITAVFIIMLFAMLISPPQFKMALTLLSLAFAIVISIAYVVRYAYTRRYTTTDAPHRSERLTGHSLRQ